MRLLGDVYIDLGISRFYRRVQVNIMRTITLNATQMCVHDISKGYVVDSAGWKHNFVKDGVLRQFSGGIIHDGYSGSVGQDLYQFDESADL